ncbi:TPA: hypothetical protein BOS_23232 [Bos taurus]|nr:TPA: hypothetical protein BOS_23232 [Bos taurus]
MGPGGGERGRARRVRRAPRPPRFWTGGRSGATPRCVFFTEEPRERVGGAICLVNSDNERDSGMLTSYATPERSASPNFLEGQVAFSHPRLSNNRSVMPLDVRGCTRATLTGSACAYPTPAGAGNPLNPIRDGDRGLQLFPMNEEFPVSAGHKLALIKSLPFVLPARRYYRLDGLVRPSDRPRRGRPTALAER